MKTKPAKTEVKISRIFSDPKLGVWLMVAAQKQMLEVRVTNSGLIRVGRPVKTSAPFYP